MRGHSPLLSLGLTDPLCLWLLFCLLIKVTVIIQFTFWLPHEHWAEVNYLVLWGSQATAIILSGQNFCRHIPHLPAA